MGTPMRWFAVGVVLCFALGLAAQEEGREGKGKEASQPLHVARPGPLRYAEIEISGPVLEMLPDMYLFEPDIDTLYDLVRRIDLARRDDSLHGVVIKLDHLGTGWAKAQEIRQAISRCREAGKEVVCFMEGGGNIDYYVASAAERVTIQRSGALFLTGLRAEVLFLKGLLDKVGVKGDMVQIGDRKGAAEPFTSTTSSDPFRESINMLLDDYYRQLVEGIAYARSMKEDHVKALIDQGPFTAKRAKEAGLVDSFEFYDDMLLDLKRRNKRNILLVPDYFKPERGASVEQGDGVQQLMKMLLGMGSAKRVTKRPAGAVIAVIYAVGPIISGEGPEGLVIGESFVSAKRMVRLIRKARVDENIKAIVLRVDSPGGSAVASDVIWHELRRADEVKPVIVSLSDLAGSGGYYIAAGGRKIYADSGTITGSIGVISGKLVLKGLFDKIGLRVDVFERGKNAGLFSSVEELSDEQREHLRELLQATYDTFLDRIVTSRKLPLNELEKLARGQSLTGYQAQRGKLVDEIGGLSDAIDGARRAAGLSEDVPVTIVRMPEPRSLLDTIIFGRHDSDSSSSSRLVPPALRLQYMPLISRPVARYLPAGWQAGLNALWCLQNEHTAVLMPGFISIR